LKGSGIVDCQIRQDLAIQFHAAFFQAVNELAVTHPIHLGSGGDAHNPKRAILALFLFAAGVCEFEAALDRLFGGTVQLGFCEEITAGAFQYLFALSAAFGSAFYTRHVLLLLLSFLRRLEAGDWKQSEWPLHSPGATLVRPSKRG